MIAPTELRIGNLVTIDNPDFHKKMKDMPVIVNGINLRMEKDFPKSSASISVTDGKFSYSQFNEFIAPIELTEDWLIRMGFQKINKNVFKIKDYEVKINQNKVRFFICSYMDAPPSVSIKHVHQLQNLFHSLTGEELKLNN